MPRVTSVVCDSTGIAARLFPGARDPVPALDMSGEPTRLGISVAFSPGPGIVDEVTLTVEPGATVADAVRASGLQARHPDFDLAALPTGVWGAFRGGDHPLRDGDRVELYRPLCVDPMEARRLRQKAGSGGSATGSA